MGKGPNRCSSGPRRAGRRKGSHPVRRLLSRRRCREAEGEEPRPPGKLRAKWRRESKTSTQPAPAPPPSARSAPPPPAGGALAQACCPEAPWDL